MKKSSLNVIILCTSIIIAVLVVVLVVGLSIPESQEVIQGEAEMTEYRVSSKVPTRVLQFKVSEGDDVHVGDTLVLLEAPDVQAKLIQAEAAYKAALAVENKARRGARQEQIQSAYEIWQKAIAGKNVAEKTYNRINKLFEEGVVAEQKRDEALANFKAMQASEKAAKSQYDMAVNGSRCEDIDAAQAQVSRAEGVVCEVASYLNETVLLAMCDGVVTEIFPEVGELVGSGAPIMNIMNSADVWFTFNVREDFLPGLRVGTQTKVYVPAFDKDVNVKITRIKEVGTFAAWKATKALDKYDLKTFEVQAYPVKTEDLEGIRAGMTAIMKQ